VYVIGPLPWRLDKVKAPWGERPSIYGHVERQIAARGAVEGDLPDEDLLRQAIARDEDESLDAYIARMEKRGALTDGDQKCAERIIGLLDEILIDVNDESIAEFYDALRVRCAENLIAARLDLLLVARVPHDHARVERFARVAEWIARNAPDREPVKLAMFFLGFFGELARDLLMTLGRHPELTNWAAFALEHGVPQPEQCIWELARSVHGPARSYLVSRLAKSSDPDVRRWLLVDACPPRNKRPPNDDAPLALECAIAGRLRAALELEDVDDQLLDGAAAIVDNLFIAPEAQGYADIWSVARLFLERAAAGEPTLARLSATVTLRLLVTSERNRGDEISAEERGDLNALCDTIASHPRALPLVRHNLERDESYWLALHAARLVGIPTLWPYLCGRIERGHHDTWWHAGFSADEERMQELLTLARTKLPLDAMATGPADEAGWGAEWQHHEGLADLIEHLDDKPGLGWDLVRVALRSPVTYARSIASTTLGSWPRSTWPPDAEALLRATLDEEPNKSNQRLMDEVLRGEYPGAREGEEDDEDLSE